MTLESRLEPESIYNVPQSLVKTEIGDPPVLKEVRKAMKQVKNTTTSISDDIRSEVSKYGGGILAGTYIISFIRSHS